MNQRKRVYLEEWLKAHSDCLARHPSYRSDMRYTAVMSPSGALSFTTRDKTLSPADLAVLEDVGREVASTHVLLIP